MKVIKFQNMKIKTLKAGGGSPKLDTPKSIDNLKKIKRELDIILSETEEKNIIVLYHRGYRIPAISNRFCNSMKIIFGSKDFSYQKNYINEKDNLGFHYDVSREQLSVAIYRLETIIGFLEDQVKEYSLSSISEWFDALKNKNNHKKFVDDINNILRKEMPNISMTTLMELVSKAESNYSHIEQYKGNNDDIVFEKPILASFISGDVARDAYSKLKKEGAKINYYNQDFIEYKTSKDIELYGVIKKINISEKLSRKNLEMREVKDLVNTKESEELFSFLENNIYQNNIKVGVIDGGIPKDSIVRKKVIYHNLKTLKIGYDDFSISNDTHAEEVCSMLLWANGLDSRTNDNCKQPSITLFDVWNKDLDSWQFLDIISKIVEKYHKEIKIWNLSSVFPNIRNLDSWKYGISGLAIQLDDIQKKFNVLFIIATGNKDDNDEDVIMSPSDSVRAISVSACALDFNKTTYSLNGQSKINKFYLVKPDVSTPGCDVDGYFTVISENKLSKSIGVSFAVPLITRKVAELLYEGIDLNMIPAILNAIATYKSSIGINDYLGNGYVPMNIREMTNLDDTNAMILFSVNSKNYSQGFFEIELPKDENDNYPYSFIMSVNVEAKTSECESFEYIEDTVRVQMGAVDPMNSLEENAEKNPKLLTHTKISIVTGDDDDSFENENSLRQYYGKYKNRYSCKRISKRAISGKRVSSKISNVIHNINKFGFTLTRNDIRSSRKGEMISHVCLIIKSINEQAIYNEIISKNINIIENSIDIRVDKSDNIKFD